MKKLKITQDEAQNIYENKGLTLLEEYKGSKYKHTCQDKNGYKYTLSLDTVKDKRTKNFAKYSVYNAYTIYNLKIFIKENGLRCELLEDDNKIVEEKDKLKFSCGICGKEYYLHYNHLLTTKKDTCNKCGYGEFAKIHTFTLEDYEKFLSETKYQLIDNVPQQYRHIHIRDSEGYKYIATTPNIRNGKVPSKFHKRNPYTIENMKLYLKQNNYPVALLEDNNKTNIEVRTSYLKFKCIECGNEYEATWWQVIRYQRYRCLQCSAAQSRYEYYVEQYLIKNKIEYVYQKRFNDCRNIKPLPFDFYLPKYNYIIEVHGEQHYYENDMFSETLKHRQYIDKIKENYCIDNGINYVAIPFWYIVNKHKIKKYKTIIDNITNQD